MPNKFLLATTISFTLLAAAFLYGYEHYFFVRLWWWDVPMHLMGGVVAGFIAATGAITVFKKDPMPMHYILGALLLGGLVELVEYFTGFGRSPFMSYPIDTAKDLIMDGVGGFVAAWSARILV
jgi:hypothetical protein